MGGTERDMHFQGFAQLLLKELDDAFKENSNLDTITEHEFAQKLGTIIAQRAYDLAVHTLRSTAYGLDLFDIQGQVNDNVPDMTKWPEYK